MRVLVEANEDKFHIMCKVRLGDLLKVREEIGGKYYMSAVNKIQSKHVDFVLCEKVKYTVKAVIELDDSSHEAKDRKARDEFVDDAMANAGIKIVHVPVKQVYSLPELKKILKGIK
jgi:very-short-patch-repair endonuclease